MKPPGISLDNFPSLRVTTPSITEDKIWEAVEAAISDGWTANRFRREVIQAWKYELESKIERDIDTLKGS